MELKNNVKVDLTQTYVFLVNKDLHMSAGKIASQVAHVALQLGYDSCFEDITRKKSAIPTIGKSIVLYATTDQMAKIITDGMVNVKYVIDAGLTEVPKDSLTCVGFIRTPASLVYTKGLELVK